MLDYLNGLRALLAMWVFYGHLAVTCAFNVPVLAAPGAAVDGFMIISGFLMVYTTQRTLGQGVTVHKAWHFHAARWFRIAPLYYVLLAVVAVSAMTWRTWADHWTQAMLISPLKLDMAGPRTDGLSDVAGVLSHLSFTFGLMPGHVEALPLPDWSLSLEMQFYLLFPLFCLFDFTRPIAMLTLAALGTAMAVWSPSHLGAYLVPGSLAHFTQPSALIYKLNVFFSGMLLARWLLANQASGVRRGLLLVVALACLAPSRPTVWVFFALFVFLLTHPESDVAKFLARPTFKVLGDWSYAVYLVHVFLMVPILYWMQVRWDVLAWPAAERYGLACLMCSPVVFGAAALLHKWIELPGMAFGRRVLARS
jgi:peptidoglycan/LPS O-acetylase OafA/YrhL